MDYSFAENLKWYRKQQKLTQHRLAKKIGVSQVLVCEWEKGVRYPSVDKVYDIARALNIEAHILLRQVEKTKNEK